MANSTDKIICHEIKCISLNLVCFKKKLLVHHVGDFFFPFNFIIRRILLVDKLRKKVEN